MTVRTLAQPEARGFTWVDVVNPTAEELAAIAAEYCLHATSVADCLDPEHLPKFEKLPGGTFAIVRGYDDTEVDGESLHALTRKLALFTSHRVLVTVHRKDQAYLTRAINEILASLPVPTDGEPGDSLLLQVTVGLMSAAVDSFLPPLERLETALDQQEASVFEERDFVGTLREIHRLKRRASVLKRLLWHTNATVVRMVPWSERSAPLLQDLREGVESVYAYADELVEDASSTLQVQLSLASHRTNAVVRLLTLFSAFFLPLTFIAGVYGMNFDRMPELRQPWGYPVALLVMGAVAAGIYVWFRRRGWLTE